MWQPASSSCCLDFATVVACHLELWVKYTFLLKTAVLSRGFGHSPRMKLGQLLHVLTLFHPSSTLLHPSWSCFVQYHERKHLGTKWFISAYQFQFIYENTQGKLSQQRWWMNAAYSIVLSLSFISAFLIQSGHTIPPPTHTVGWTHTNQLALKKIHQSHDHRAVWSRHFFSWGSLILSVPSFLSTWLLKLTIILAVIFCFIYCCFIYYLVKDYLNPDYRNPM